MSQEGESRTAHTQGLTRQPGIPMALCGCRERSRLGGVANAPFPELREGRSPGRHLRMRNLAHSSPMAVQVLLVETIGPRIVGLINS